jgi:hypothetical protein
VLWSRVLKTPTYQITFYYLHLLLLRFGVFLSNGIQKDPKIVFFLNSKNPLQKTFFCDVFFSGGGGGGGGVVFLAFGGFWGVCR